MSGNGHMLDMTEDAIAARRHCGCGRGIKPGNGDAPRNADLRCCIACVQKWKDREK